MYEIVSIGYPGLVLRGRPIAEPYHLGRGWVGFDFVAAFGGVTHLQHQIAIAPARQLQSPRSDRDARVVDGLRALRLVQTDFLYRHRALPITRCARGGDCDAAPLAQCAVLETQLVVEKSTRHILCLAHEKGRRYDSGCSRHRRCGCS
jgi:hypothetical protein